jgi:hypothetical protein
MRLLIASLAALTAVALAAPAFAQDSQANPTPTPITKSKAGTAASCKAMKTTASRNACLKRAQASSAPTKAKAAKTRKPAAEPAAKPDSAAEVLPLPSKVI